GFHPRRFPLSSRSFIARHARHSRSHSRSHSRRKMMRQAPVWGWLSCVTSLNCTEAASRWRAKSASVPFLLCACHSFNSNLRINMSKPHVLIVDDEKSIRLAIETGLSLDGFSVSSARSGREAISAARSQKFDVVVCDIFMPDGDGLD